MSAARPTIICCTHQEPRIDSPEPASRPLASTAITNNLDSILTTTTTTALLLPEDHPDAQQQVASLFGGGIRKPLEPNSSIIRSPSLAAKLRFQLFRSRSTKDLRKHHPYDEDAHRLTSQDVLHGISEEPAVHDAGLVDADGKSNIQASILSERLLNDSNENDRSQISPVACSDLHMSALQGLEWLNPLIRRPSDAASTSIPPDIAEGSSPEADRCGSALLVDLPPTPVSRRLRKACSSPDFGRFGREVSALLQPRRARSDILSCHGVFSTNGRAANLWNEICDFSAPGTDAELPGDQDISRSMPHQVKSERKTNTIASQQIDCGNDGDPTRYEPQPAKGSVGLHLHMMDISKQLRSMSQMSDAIDDEAIRPLSSGLWTLRQRSGRDIDTLISIDKSWAKHASRASHDEGIHSPFPRLWSPAPSSVYSRTLSPSRITLDMMRSSTDIPLQEVSEDSISRTMNQRSESTPRKDHAMSLLDEPLDSTSVVQNVRDPVAPIQSDSCNGSNHAELTRLDQGDGLIQSNASSSPGGPLSKKGVINSKTGPKKQKATLVRLPQSIKDAQKRLFIFKLLRFSGRKRQARSVSMPVLPTQVPEMATTFDGPADDSSLLAVEYEMEECPRFISVRSASMSQLRPPPPGIETASILTEPPSLERQPTLAEYERRLSVIGDDRRRPSMVNLKTLADIQEDDRRDSNGLQRRLSRARTLKDDASPLMESALEKHREEKALFRSASKQRDSLISAWPQENSRNSRSPGKSAISSRKSDLEDASSNVRSKRLRVSKVNSVENLRALRAREVSQPRPTTPRSLAHSIPIPRRISTSLASWSRYPSHTRSERCASAGRNDSVTPRDFAFDINLDDVHSVDEAAAVSPLDQQTKPASRSPRLTVRKTRSLTFRSIIRYYSNLFRTADFKGQNRRTSISVGGRVEHPELEMIPPQIPADQTRASHDPLGHIKEHLEDDMEKIKKHVKDGEEKVRAYARKEKDHVKHLVHKDKLLPEENADDNRDNNNIIPQDHTALPSYLTPESSKIYNSDSGEIFSANRLFAAERPLSQHADDNNSIGPYGEIGESPSSDISRLQLDSTGNQSSGSKVKSQSKAETWSHMYKECVGARPQSTDADELNQPILLTSTFTAPNTIMGPPSLNPLKRRTSLANLKIDSGVTIRRFPSVTVVDDRKGHWRSISLISIGKAGSGGVQGESTNDFSELIKLRQHEEHGRVKGVRL